MPGSPNIVLAILGALLVLVAIVGKVQAERLNIGLSTTPSRVLAAIIGVICLSLSVYLHFHPVLSSDMGEKAPAKASVAGLPEGVETPDGSSKDVNTLAGSGVPDKSIMEGEWNVTVESTLRIVWKLKVSVADGELSARGPKLFVNGQSATAAERETYLVLQGKVSGPAVKGRYTENQPVRQVSGDFQVEFTKDGSMFSGVLFTPSGRDTSRISGVRVQK